MPSLSGRARFVELLDADMMQFDAVREGGSAATVVRMVLGKEMEGSMASSSILNKERSQMRGGAMSPRNVLAV